MKTKSEKLRDMRTGRGLTQKAVAQAIGVSAPTMCNLERGIAPNANQAHLLAEYFGVDVSELWTPPKMKQGRN